MEFFTFTLPNGIRCVHKRVPSLVTHCALAVNAGSRDELAREHGMAHFVEHGLFKGTARRRSWQINSRLENLGGELNAFTSKEDTMITATTLRRDFAKAAELIADMALRSTFPEREIEREKQVIVDEINSYRDSPQEMFIERFDGMMFAGSPLGRTIAGTARSVAKFDSKALRGFVSRNYTSDQMVFSAIGNMSEKAFAAVCESYFGTLPATRRDFSRVPPPQHNPFDKSVAHKGNHQSHCMLGNRAFGLHDERRLALSLLVNVLGGPAANSRLNTVLRERNGLTYNVEASYFPYSDCGLATIYFSCEQGRLERCRELVGAEIDKILTSPLSPRQLSMAKKQFIGQFVISMDANDGNMIGAAKTMLTYNEIESQKKIVQKIGDISADELMKVAHEVFSSLSSLTYM